MQTLTFEEAIEQLVERDPRYQRAAYVFLKDALEFTRQSLARDRKGAPRQQGRSAQAEERHVTVPELLEGIRDYALKMYGPMVITVFEDWGIRGCPDFGNVLFNLVEANYFSITEHDTREQFEPGFDFHEAFRRPFLPSNAQSRAGGDPACA